MFDDPDGLRTIAEIAEALRERYSTTARSRLIALLREGIRADQHQNRIELQIAERARRRQHKD
jgi:hypothetical protein